MKRTILGAFAILATTFAIAPAFADDTPLRNDRQVRHFWHQQDKQEH
jgi:Spy/CpxP family protein refolding chaperone